MTSQPDPDLSPLTGLEKLEIKGFMAIFSVRGLRGLKEPSIHSCNVDGADALSSLNYYVESYGGMTSVLYDDVKLG